MINFLHNASLFNPDMEAPNNIYRKLLNLVSNFDKNLNLTSTLYFHLKFFPKIYLLVFESRNLCVHLRINSTMIM